MDKVYLVVSRNLETWDIINVFAAFETEEEAKEFFHPDENRRIDIIVRPVLKTKEPKQ